MAPSPGRHLALGSVCRWDGQMDGRDRELSLSITPHCSAKAHPRQSAQEGCVGARLLAKSAPPELEGKHAPAHMHHGAWHAHITVPTSVLADEESTKSARKWSQCLITPC